MPLENPKTAKQMVEEGGHVANHPGVVKALIHEVEVLKKRVEDLERGKADDKKARGS